MKPLYTQFEFDASTSTTKLPLECESCGDTYYKPKKEIKYALKKNRNIKYCSQTCFGLTTKKSKLLTCLTCGNSFTKLNANIQKSKNHFCSLSCAGIYNSNNRTKGTRRSKLEVYLEDSLTQLYPNLQIDYNKTYAIQAELDIYIPSLKLAFELNGIFHYEPIFGDKKLNQTKNKDKYKFKACIENQIDLCVIDTSNFRYFKTEGAKKYLDIINNIIKERLLTS
jgi:hypothetical protein